MMKTHDNVGRVRYTILSPLLAVKRLAITLLGRILNLMEVMVHPPD